MEIKTDPEKAHIREVRTTHPIAAKSVAAALADHDVTHPYCSSLALWKKALIRPFVLFATEPIIQLFGLYLAFIYGTIYRTHRFYASGLSP